MRSTFTALLILLICYTPELYGQLIPVKASRVRLMERQVEGFQVMVRKPRAEVKQGIRNHFATYIINPPVSFEDFMIFEQLDYPAVSVSQPISFFYQLEDISGLMTRLTLVGSYDYQKPINISEAPDLSLRLLLDLAEMVRKISGDTINFDPLFSETTAAELRKKYEERESRFQYEDIVERKRDWVGDIGETRLKKDPFSDYEALEMKDDEKIVEQISSRFQDYLKNAPSESTQFLDDNSAEQISQYRDSLMDLQLTIDELRASLIQASFRQDSLYTQIANLQESQPETMDTLMDTPLFSRTDSILFEQGKMAVDSLSKVNQELKNRIAEQEEQMKALNSFGERQDSLIKKYQAEIAVAASANDPKARIAQLEEERKELYQVQETDRDLIQILRGRLSEQDKLLNRNEERMTSLKDSFRQEIATLNPESDAAKIRRQVYLKQQKELEEAQIALEQLEWEVKIRETRMDQREKFLANYELKGKEAQLMQRVVELEKRIDQLTQERLRFESQKKGKQAAIRIDPASTTIKDQRVPAFAVKSKEAPELLREQILQWARLKNIKPKGEGDELCFDNIRLPELSADALTLRFSFALQNSGESLLFVSFQEGEDLFIRTGSNTVQSQKAYALLLQIFE
ncbi:MAG: hypothetical protein R8P61_25750 [Bacteroidia bacterium]|nr:hypothetical protein [Bacteroidia bacterium]